MSVSIIETTYHSSLIEKILEKIKWLFDYVYTFILSVYHN